MASAPQLDQSMVSREDSAIVAAASGSEYMKKPGFRARIRVVVVVALVVVVVVVVE